MNSAVRMLVVLSSIAVISGAALGGLHEATRELAENNVLKFKKIPAVVDLYAIVEDGTSDQRRLELEAELLADKRFLDTEDQDPILFFVIKKDGAPYAVTLEEYGQGFGGKLGVMVGFQLEAEKLVGIGVTTLSETPGVGTKVREPSFTEQFVGMSRSEDFQIAKDGGVVDAISGATISSRAVAEAVLGAQAVFDQHMAAIREIALQPATAIGDGDSEDGGEG